ncbi:MAG: hypothetical protein VX132_00555 [Actinomycetota bacterium]|nr:hypothetical protein [Actinomycetota bacterium]
MGVDIGEKMVAAAYPHRRSVEIALALSENHPNSALKDASHLTWRTLPVSLEVSDITEIDQHANLFIEACNRVQRGELNEPRDNEFFRKKQRERSEKRSKR